MTYPLARVVDAPDPSATVRYDFSDEDAVAPRRVTPEGFTLGVPTLQGDPDSVGFLYGWRKPFVPHRIKGEKRDALEALAVLSREILRYSNWLLVQLDAVTRPIWLRVYPTEPGELSFDRVSVDAATGDPGSLPDAWLIGVPFTADAFAYGERITLGPYTVTQTPDGDNPMRVELPTIHGDAPTALRVEVKAATTNARTSRFLLAAVSGDSVSDLLIDVGTGDDWTAGTDTSAPVTDSDYAGGSYRTVTISTGGLDAGEYEPRISGTVDDIVPGRYKVLHRCELDPVDSSTPQRYALAFGQDANGEIRWGQTVYQETSTLNGSSNTVTYPFQGWVDLGEFTFPLGVTLPGDLIPATVSADVAVRLGTVSGVGEARLDALKFIPVDGPTIVRTTLLSTEFEPEVTDQSYPVLPLSETASCTWDGDAANRSGLVWMQEQPSGDLLPSAVVPQGGFPMVDPAASENVLVAFATGRGRTDDDDAGTAVATEWTVTPSYQPRLLHLDGRP